MKNTKNLLMTGVIFATGLFGSTQIFADLNYEQQNKISALFRQVTEQFYDNIEIYSQVLENRKSTDLQIQNAKNNMDIAGEQAKAYGRLLRTKKSYSKAELDEAINTIKYGSIDKIKSASF